MKELDNLIESTFESKQKSKIDLISLVESVLDTYYDLGFDKSESPKQEVMQEQESTNFSKGREFILSLPKFAPQFHAVSYHHLPFINNILEDKYSAHINDNILGKFYRKDFSNETD